MDKQITVSLEDLKKVLDGFGYEAPNRDECDACKSQNDILSEIRQQQNVQRPVLSVRKAGRN